MRKIKRWKYYCDFCKKSGGHAGHLRKHESRCTMNPDRFCGFCKLIENIQPEIKILLAVLPDPSDDKYTQSWSDGGFTVEKYYDSDKMAEDANAGLKKLREISDCPGCIMAALRQKGIPVPLVTDFDFKKECASIWSDFNDSQRDYDD